MKLELKKKINFMRQWTLMSNVICYNVWKYLVNVNNIWQNCYFLKNSSCIMILTFHDNYMAFLLFDSCHGHQISSVKVNVNVNYGFIRVFLYSGMPSVNQVWYHALYRWKRVFAIDTCTKRSQNDVLYAFSRNSTTISW